MALTAGSIEIKLFADIARLQSDMNKANKTVDTAMRNIDKSVNLAKRAFGGLIGGTLIGQVIKLADEYKKFDSQLKLSTKTLNDYNQSYENVIRISRTAQSDINAVGVLYARLNNNLRDFNVTQGQVAAVTENVSLALRVNNATVQETSSVMLQLSQSFGSGRLNGQEFLAVAEGAPALLRQLAKSMNVPFGALKELSAQGKITKEELLKAFSDPAFLAANREMVKSVGTISSAITVFTNNLKLFIGEQDKASGASKVVTSVIMTLADNINLLANVAIAGAIVATGRYISAKFALIASYRSEMAALSAKQAGDVVAARSQVVLMEAQIAANLATNAGTLALSNNAMAATVNAKQTAALAAAKAGLATATTAANVGLTTARGLLAALGGPIGAIITALGLAAVAFQTFGKSGTEALDALYEKARLANKELEKTPEALLKAVPTLLEQNAAKRAKLIEKEIDLQKTLDNLVAKGADKNMPGYVAAIQGQLIKVQNELNLSLQVYNDLQMQRLDSEERIKQTTDKAAAAEKFLRDQKIKFLNEELEEQRQIIKAAQEANIEASTRNKIIAEAKKKMDDLTGATKINREEMKQAKKDHEAVIKQAIELAKQEAKAYEEFNDAQKKARQDEIEAIDKQNETLQKGIDKLNENIYTAQYGEEAFRQLENARLNDAIATAKQTLEQAKQNGATAEAIKYAEDFIVALEKQVELKKQSNDLESTEEMWKRAKEIEKDKLDAAKKGAKDLEKVNDRVAQSFSDALSNAIMRGFESGKSFAYNFKDTLILAFKSLVLRPMIDFVINASGINAVLGKVGGIISGGTAAAGQTAAEGGGILDSLMAGGKNIYEAVVDGFDVANDAFQKSIEKFGSWVAGFGEQGSVLSDLGGVIGQYSKEIAIGSSYLDATIKLLSGDVKGAAFSAAGATIGGFIGGGPFNPIGAAIGSFVGNAVGSLFGKKSPKMYGNTATGAFSGGTFTPTGEANFGRNMGAGDALTDLNQAFSESFGALLKAFDENVQFTVSSLFRKRTNVRARFDISINGVNINPVGGKYNSGGFEAFAKDVMGTGIIEGIKASNLPQAIKNVFNNIAVEVSDSTKRTEGVNALINSIIALQKASTGLSNKFGLTVDQAVQLADTVTDTNEQLVAFIGTLSTIGQAGITVGEQVLKVKDALTSAFSQITGTGALPENLDSFDAALKAINKTTQEGINKFADLLSIRADFVTFTEALAEIKGGVDSAIFSLLTPAQQFAKLQSELGNMFGSLNLSTPKSVQELIALGESIDLTTKEGINLATVFPTLVDAFVKTNQAAQGLVGTMQQLNTNSFKTLVDYTRAQAYMSAGIPLSSLPSYAVGTSYVPQTGPALIHQGERILTASENSAFGAGQAELASEIRALRMDNQEMRRELQSIAISTKSTAKVMDRQDRDGIIIRDVNNEGDPQILKVEIV